MTSTSSQQNLSSARSRSDVPAQQDSQKPPIEWFLPCEWSDCNKQLISMDALLEHMYTSHVKLAEVHDKYGGRWECKWTLCEQQRRKFHYDLRSERALMTHLRTIFERDTRWACGCCDACAVVRITDLIEHHEFEHGVLVRSPDHGAKAAARKNGTHAPPASGASPKLPHYSTAQPDKLFTGWRKPIDLRALAPKTAQSPQHDRESTIRGDDDDENETRAEDPLRRGTKRKRTPGADAENAEANTEDRQVVTTTTTTTTSVDFEVNVNGRPEADPSPGRWQSANIQVEVDITNNSAALPGAPTQASARLRRRGERMSTSPRPRSRDQPPADAPQPPPQRSVAPDYRAAYLIEKAKYRFVTDRQEKLREELEQLRAEYEDAYATKEHALDQVLRAKFGSTADVLTHPPSR